MSVVFNGSSSLSDCIDCSCLIEDRDFVVAWVESDCIAIKHGVAGRPVCVNRSRWDCALERIGSTDRLVVRLGFRQVKGLAVAEAARIVAPRMNNSFASIDGMWRRSSVPTEALGQL